MSVKSVRGSAKLCYVGSFLQLYAKIHTAPSLQVPEFQVLSLVKKKAKKKKKKQMKEKKDRMANLAGFIQDGFRRPILGYRLI